MDRDSRPTDHVDYLDFDLEIGRGRARKYPVSARSSVAGEAHAEMRFPYTEQVLENRLLALELAVLQTGGTRRRISSPREQTAQVFGRELFDALLTGDLRSLYGESLRAAEQQGKGLRIRLHVEPPELAALPWEFLYDARRGEYVCLSTQTPLVRYPDLPQPIERLPVVPPLRILGMVVSATDLAALDIEHEKTRVEEALKDLLARGAVELVWLEGQTWRDLQRAMRRGPWHVFHFIGHGGFDVNTDEGLIALADDAGNSHLLRATDLGRLLDDHHPLRLVVLNSCEGARGSERDAFSGTAATLVRRGIPAVLAMQYEITDEAAIEFSRDFYEAVADGLPVDAAVSEARTAVSIHLGDTLEWGTPVLYMRSPDGRVFDMRPPSDAKPKPRTATVLPITSVVEEDSTPTTPEQAATVSNPAPTHRRTTPTSDESDDETAKMLPAEPPGEPPSSPQAGAFRVGAFLQKSWQRSPILLTAVLLGAGALLLAGWLLLDGRPDRLSGVSPTVHAGTATSGGDAPADLSTDGTVLPESPTEPRRAESVPTEVQSLPTTASASGGAGASGLSSDGAMFRGNLAHTGVYDSDGPIPTEGRLEWRFTTDGKIERPPAIVGDVAYFGSRDTHLYALDLRTRVAKWIFKAGEAVRSAPAVAGDVVYAGSDDRNLYAIDAKTGKQRWAFVTGGQVYAAPAVAEGVVYFGSQDDHVYALDARSGRLRWKYKTGGDISSSPAVVGGTVYVGSQDNHLYALRAASGEEIWSLRTGGPVSSSPAVAGDLVYVGSGDGRLYAVDRKHGRSKWDLKTGDQVVSSPAVAYGLVVVGSHDGKVYALDAETGRRRWTFETGGFVGSSPSVADSLVIFGSGDKNLYALDIATGDLRWTYETEEAVATSPAIADGVVYFGGLDKYLYVVR